MLKNKIFSQDFFLFHSLQSNWLSFDFNCIVKYVKQVFTVFSKMIFVVNRYYLTRPIQARNINTILMNGLILWKNELIKAHTLQLHHTSVYGIFTVYFDFTFNFFSQHSTNRKAMIGANTRRAFRHDFVVIGNLNAFQEFIAKFRIVKVETVKWIKIWWVLRTWHIPLLPFSSFIFSLLNLFFHSCSNRVFEKLNEIRPLSSVKKLRFN